MQRGLSVSRYHGYKMEIYTDGHYKRGITCNEQGVAFFQMDYQGEVEAVVLLTDDVRMQRFVKELALSHVVQFVGRDSRRVCSLEIATLDKCTSEELLDFKRIPVEVSALTDEALDQHLSNVVSVVRWRFNSPEEMLARLLLDLREKTGVQLKVRDAQWARIMDSHIVITFETQDNEHTFKVWKCLSRDHHFIPPYYPSRLGKKQNCLLNGATDAYINGRERAIDQVLSPEEARAGEAELFLFSSWSKIKHPFYAEGKTLGVQFSTIFCMAQAGYEALLSLLTAALNVGEEYVAVSGGFQAPYDSAHNVIIRKGIVSPAGRHGSYNARGCEDSCVWEHEVLESEGALGQSLAPEWFYREGWINIFADEEKLF